MKLSDIFGIAAVGSAVDRLLAGVVRAPRGGRDRSPGARYKQINEDVAPLRVDKLAKDWVRGEQGRPGSKLARKAADKALGKGTPR